MDTENLEKIANDNIELALSMKELQGIAIAMIDNKEYFNNDEKAIKEFFAICRKKGFNADYIENVPYFNLKLKNKIVIWQ